MIQHLITKHALDIGGDDIIIIEIRVGQLPLTGWDGYAAVAQRYSPRTPEYPLVSHQ